MDTPRLFLLATVSGCLFGPLAAQEAPRKVKRIAAPAARLIPAGAPTPKSQDELRAAFDKKLASAFVKNAGWITDFDAAKAEAHKTGKKIFAYFTRSYAP